MSKLIAMSISELDTLIGENRVRALCNGFSSPLNLEVESFLKDKARQSAALSSSVTYLVLDENVGHALGYDKDDGITYDQMVRVIEPATVAEAAR